MSRGALRIRIESPLAGWVTASARRRAASVGVWRVQATLVRKAFQNTLDRHKASTPVSTTRSKCNGIPNRSRGRWVSARLLDEEKDEEDDHPPHPPEQLFGPKSASWKREKSSQSRRAFHTPVLERERGKEKGNFARRTPAWAASVVPAGAAPISPDRASDDRAGTRRGRYICHSFFFFVKRECVGDVALEALERTYRSVCWTAYVDLCSSTFERIVSFPNSRYLEIRSQELRGLRETRVGCKQV